MNISDSGKDNLALPAAKMQLLAQLQNEARLDIAALQPVVDNALQQAPNDLDLVAAKLILQAESGEPVSLDGISAIVCPLIANKIVMMGRLHAARLVVRAIRQQKKIKSMATLHEVLARSPRRPRLLRKFRDDKSKDVQFIESADPRASVLIACFCGIADAMSVQLNALHPWLAHSRAHIMYLRDRNRTLFQSGIKSLGDSVQTIASLKETIAAAGIKRIICIGSSGGTFGALHYAPRLGAQHVLCFAGPSSLELAAQSPDRKMHALVMGRLNDMTINLPDLRAVYAAHPEIKVRYVVGDRNQFDVTQAEYLKDLPSVEIVKLPKYRKHNVLVGLVRRKLFLGELEYAVTGQPPLQQSAA